MSQVTREQRMQRLAGIRGLIFDVDGVLTDGSLFLGDDGQEYKAFNSRDGLGIRMVMDAGVEIGIITGRQSNVVKLRMDSLGVDYVYQGRYEKGPAMDDLLEKMGLTSEQVVYVGDDVVDLPAMQRAGFPVAVADAHELVCEKADWVTSRPGGRGAAREVCEEIMRAQGTWEQAVARYLA